MYFNYRVVQISDNEFSVCRIEYDAEQKPISYTPVDLTGENVQDLSTLLIYCTSSLTEPVLDVKLFIDNSTTNAINMMRQK